MILQFLVNNNKFHIKLQIFAFSWKSKNLAIWPTFSIDAWEGRAEDLVSTAEHTWARGWRREVVRQNPMLKGLYNIMEAKKEALNMFEWEVTKWKKHVMGFLRMILSFEAVMYTFIQLVIHSKNICKLAVLKQFKSMCSNGN